MLPVMGYFSPIVLLCAVAIHQLVSAVSVSKYGAGLDTELRPKSQWTEAASQSLQFVRVLLS